MVLVAALALGQARALLAGAGFVSVGPVRRLTWPRTFAVVRARRAAPALGGRGMVATPAGGAGATKAVETVTPPATLWCLEVTVAPRVAVVARVMPGPLAGAHDR